MSAGAFENGKYELGGGQIARVRVQPETKALVIGAQTNTYPAADPTLPGRYPLNLNGKRRKPFSARSVSVKLTAALAGYKPDSILKIPIFRPAMYNAIIEGATGTYLGTAIEVVGKSNEQG